MDAKKRVGGKTKPTREGAARSERSSVGNPPEVKLSAAIAAMATSVLRAGEDGSSVGATAAAVFLATSAWNEANGFASTPEERRLRVGLIQWGEATPWAEFVSGDPERLFELLVRYKQTHFADDTRHVMGARLDQDAQLEVDWVPAHIAAHLSPAVATPTPPAPEPPKPAPSPAPKPIGKAQPKARTSPIANMLSRDIRRLLTSRTVDIRAFATGKQTAAALQESIASRAELAELHPVHATYVFAYNQVSILCEQLTALKEMAPFVELIETGQREYAPFNPPMSPITDSFFGTWAFFDACVGKARETVGTIVMSVGTAAGMSASLVNIIGILQASKMAMYACEGGDSGVVVLRELVTGKVCKAINPTGYVGRRGELWFARVLPPPFAGTELHMVFTTPYVLVAPNEVAWLAYLDRTLGAGTRTETFARYEDFMKFGPTRNYWLEFVFEAYHSHRSNVVFLTGLPDVAESRPHSKAHA